MRQFGRFSANSYLRKIFRNTLSFIELFAIVHECGIALGQHVRNFRSLLKSDAAVPLSVQLRLRNLNGTRNDSFCTFPQMHFWHFRKCILGFPQMVQSSKPINVLLSSQALYWARTTFILGMQILLSWCYVCDYDLRCIILFTENVSFIPDFPQMQERPGFPQMRQI